MTRSHAKALRANMTEAERRLWYFLRSHRFAGMKFKRQALIGRYIVDFVSFQRRLVVEVDGGQHADSEADLPRTRWLEDQGFRILRFWNNEVLSNSGGVLDTIMVAATNPSPGPPFRGAPPSPTRGEGKNERQ
jgi:very-short-patch-repair endonuclease